MNSVRSGKLFATERVSLNHKIDRIGMKLL